MAVGGVGRGGGRGGPKGVGGKPASGSGFAGKVSGNEGIARSSGLVGASGAARSSEAGAVAATDPVSAGAQAIAKALKEGKIPSKQEATKQLVALILKNRNLGGSNSKSQQKLVEKIADTLADDPRLTAALERTWNRAGQGSK